MGKNVSYIWITSFVVLLCNRQLVSMTINYWLKYSNIVFVKVQCIVNRKYVYIRKPGLCITDKYLKTT